MTRVLTAWFGLMLLVTPLCADDMASADQDLEARHAEVMEVLDTFMATFNAMDHEGHTATYHFPHVRIAGGRVAVSPTAADYPRDYFEKNLIPAGWHRSGWIERKIVQSSPDKVHVATTFRRYRKDGSTLADYQSLYIVSRIDGRWGVQGRSSFAQ